MARIGTFRLGFENALKFKGHTLEHFFVIIHWGNCNGCKLTKPDARSVGNSVSKVVYSDNGPQCVNQKFKMFAEECRFKYKTSSSVYAKSNGMAERYVQIAKKLLKKAKKSEQDVQLTPAHVWTTNMTLTSISSNRRKWKNEKSVKETTERIWKILK